jgi:hypothetical protein
VVEGVVTGLVILAVGGIATAAWRATRSRWSPVHVRTEQVLPEAWAVALPGELPDPVDLEATQPDPAAVHRWLLGLGGVAYRQLLIRVRLEGRAHRIVTIREIGVIVERESPITHTLVSCPTAGANSATFLLFDLDDGRPRAWEWADDAGPRVKVGKAPFFDTNNITLTPGEVHECLIVATTRKSLCRFRFAVRISVGRRDARFTIDESGKPFSLSGAARSEFATRLDWAWYQIPNAFGDRRRTNGVTR